MRALPDIPAFAARYVAGDRSSETCDAVAHWTAGDPTRRAVLEQWTALWAAVPVRTQDGEAGEVIAKQLTARIVAHVESGESVHPTVDRSWGGTGQLGRRALLTKEETHASRTSRILESRLLKAIIGAAAVFLVGAMFHKTHVDTERPSVTTYRTKSGERAAVVLPDSNHVILAPQTTLVVRGTTVMLTGEALFSIAHHTGSPFIVRTGTVVTRVLGTTFDVRRYADDRETRIAVTDGRVETSVSPRVGAHMGSRAIIVSVGRVARIADSTVILSDDAASVTAWTTGSLVFDKVPVAEILSTAGRWYGYTFRLVGRDSTTLSRWRVTVTLDGRSVEDAMSALAALLNVRATLDSTTATGLRTITLHTGQSAQSADPVAVPLRRDAHDILSLRDEVGR